MMLETALHKEVLSSGESYLLGNFKAPLILKGMKCLFCLFMGYYQ